MKKVLIPDWPVADNVIAYTTMRDTPEELIPQQQLNQVHGAEVVCADEIEGIVEADAIYSNLGTQCVIRTADCLPVLLCNKNLQIAAIHAGWRSLAQNIIDYTLQKIDKQDCYAWLGPAIGSSKFEVGEDVLEYFTANGWDHETLQNNFKSINNSKFLADLYGLARGQLIALGILEQNIYGGTWCTYSEPEKFYSHRRTQDKGRMYSLISKK